ncbi:aromatic prenyltransferase [Aspergillus karnatakaensis]|uniref:aromatic prenyltransferase n=1 Tax=Aspergillus karnatakaensis TaxID=1810916 RepID=UPI003CCE3B81
MATMFEEAGYSRERQYEYLLIHYHWTDIITGNGVPPIYSWKWNDTNQSSKPDIRIGFEPIGAHSRTALNPLNQFHTKELIHTFANRMPVDLTWTNHFLSTCYDSETKYWQASKSGAPLATTAMVGYDYLHDSMTLKTALDILHDFLKTNPRGKALVPTGLAVDKGTSSPTGKRSSRLKFYFRIPKTTFSSVRAIMTLGGRIPGLEPQSESLHALLSDITGLPKNFPDDADIPVYHGFGTGASPLGRAVYYLYYFDIAPGADIPHIKFYIPLTHYGQNDLKSAQGVTRWIESQGRGSYGANHLQMLEKVAEEQKLEEGDGLQSYRSCLFRKDGELDVTSYFLTQRC